MTPEADRYLAKARLSLDHARKMLAADLTEDAGRAAYAAGFHAAQALIFERTGRIAKTHRGVHAEFARLAAKEPRIDNELKRFLPRAYDLKVICDYDVAPDAVVPRPTAAATIQAAERFVDWTANLIATPTPGQGGAES